MSLGSFVNKFVVTVFSVLIFILGLVVIALASITIERHSKYVEKFAEGTVTFPIIVLVFGVFITLNGLCGFCGAVGDNPTCLYVYGIAGFILFMGELAGGIIILTSPDDTEKKVKIEMDKEFRNFGKKKGRDSSLKEGNKTKASKGKDDDDGKLVDPFIYETNTKLINSLQEKVKCCGLDSYKDWTEKYTFESIPMSCCKEEILLCYTNKTDNIYTEGCYKKTLDLLGGVFIALGYMAIVLAFIQFVVICMACVLARNQQPDRIIR
ncbi:UNVERIFIED_CONTAM: hypothetical protein RMT77_009239 [Armadillidium vulgare]